MTLGTRLLKMIYPAHEAQRMELRRMILEVEACAEDMTRTIRNGRTVEPVSKAYKMNGKGKVV